MPKEMAHSHLGMATDGRYIYVVTGQYGPQCRGPTARNFVLDTETKEWHDLPPLPVPRYVGLMINLPIIFKDNVAKYHDWLTSSLFVCLTSSFVPK